MSFFILLLLLKFNHSESKYSEECFIIWNKMIIFVG
jgi:hypothetical protein